MGSGTKICPSFGITDQKFEYRNGINDEKNMPNSLRPWYTPYASYCACIYVANNSFAPQASCEGTGHVVVTFKSYRNPTHRKSNGNCCDFKWFGKVCNPCDAYFKLCVADSPSSSSCNIGQAQTGVVGDKDNHHNINIRKDFAFNSFRVSV